MERREQQEEAANSSVTQNHAQIPMIIQWGI
jgi:hypothetical protein